MRTIVAIALTVWALVGPVNSYTADEMLAEFEAENLTHTERRFLQMSLAFQGRYVALVDGAWGRGSQIALNEWAVQSGLDLPVTNLAVMFLATDAIERFNAEGWEQYYLEWLDMSVAVPVGRMRMDPNSGDYISFTHLSSSLRYSVTVGTLAQAVQIHDRALGSSLAISTPYTLRRDTVQITSVEQPEGWLLYARSDLRRGGWTTILLSATARDSNILRAVSGSIAKGQSATFDLPRDGKILQGIASLASIVAESDAEKGRNQEGRRDATRLPVRPLDPPSIAASEPVVVSNGTGFMVSAEGHLLTNAHVVEGCESLTVAGKPAEVLATDSSFDLALLKGSPGPADDVASFAASPAPLNSDITIAGYPLSRWLSGLNVTRGSVTSLKGLAGDATTMQISAPVQPGNSGGPVVDSLGHVVGVVVSKLNAQRVADATGDIPQNVNFSIRGEIAKLFLFQNGVDPIVGTSSADSLNPVEMAQRLERMTRLVECFGPPR